MDPTSDTEPSSAPESMPPERPTLESLAAQIAAMQRDVRVVITRGSTPPEPEAPTSSMRVAAKKTATATRVGMLVLGSFAAAGEVIAQIYPHAIGPISTIFRLLLRVLGSDTP